MQRLVKFMSAAGLLALGCAGGANESETIDDGSAAVAATGNATLVYSSDWGSGYCADITISNALSRATSRWQVVMDLKSTTVTQTWNSKTSGRTGRVTFTPSNTNNSIAPGGTTKFGFCANASGPSVRPTLLAWNMEANVYASCATNSGTNPAKAALAIAMGKELGRWTPNQDLTVSNGKVVLSSAALAQCNPSGCPNTKALLGQQDAAIMQYVDQTLFNPTNFSADLQASFGRQTNMITDLQRNNPGKLPPRHKLTLVGGPTNMGPGSCGPHYIFQVDNPDGSPLGAAQAANMGNALCFYGYGNCGANPFVGFMQTGVNCPPGRTCVAIDPMDGDNGSVSTTSAGSAPTYPMDRVYDPRNMLLGTSCISAMGAFGGLQSKCSRTPSSCGYLYCMR